MDESRKTPDILPKSDSFREVFTSSPVKPIIQPVSGHKAEELAQRMMLDATRDTSVDTMWELLGNTPEGMRTEFPMLKLPVFETIVKQVKSLQSRSKSVYKPYVNLLNSISGSIHAGLHKEDTSKKPSVFYWSALEATGELPPGNDRKGSALKIAAYTSFLLQARPDRVRVQGIYVEHKGFKLIVSNACGAFYTQLLEWGTRPFRLLLAAWILALYRPVVDSSITVHVALNAAPKFKINCPDRSYEDCTILSVGSGFGRRTIVFRTTETNVIIKEQYIETCRRFEEGEILSKIHQKGSFPGVVRKDWSGPVVSNQKEILVKRQGAEAGPLYERQKVRIVLLDEAGSLMDVETLREALIAIYDLLEITRFLHTHRKTLHRDISIHNILLRKTFPIADAKQSSSATDIQEMCFASYLLNPKSASSQAGRLDTRVLLIDFDMGEDQEWKMASPNTLEKHKKGPRSRTGTPVFMARAVRSAKKLSGEYTLAPMPQLHDGRDIYEKAVGNRLAFFPLNERESLILQDDKSLEPFAHKLRYDAESVFWLLVWWALQSQPEVTDDPEVNHIPDFIWSMLTDTPDARDSFFPRFPRGAVHPGYQQLEPLLQLMAKQLDGDLEESNEPSRRKDEYLHEAFQRLIFGFLAKNYDEPFMTTRKSASPRTPRRAMAMQVSIPVHQVNKDRKSASVQFSSSGLVPPSGESPIE